MNDTIVQLKKIFGLEDTAKDADLIAQATKLAAEARAGRDKAEEESEVNKLVSSSIGALSHKQAREVLTRRAHFSASQKAKRTKAAP